MKKVINLLVLLTVTSALSLAIVGCKGHGEHPKADHPKAEHTKAEHPKAEHPKADHEHPE